MPSFAMLMFPQMTPLDLVGPYEVFSRVPGATVRLVWKTLETVVTEPALPMRPNTRFGDLAQADVLFVPGGPGVNPLLTDRDVLAWVRRIAARASYVSSVCTGALVLGAAGLLQGKRATTHWTAMDMLPRLGAVPQHTRTVVDGRLVTGSGVSAGIDLALQLVGDLSGPAVARSIQLAIEYAPRPPFDSGHPDSAPPQITEAHLKRIERRQAVRWNQVHVASAWLRALA